MIQTIKWVGTVLILVGVLMNILNNPELQQYIYPYNLFISSFASFLLLSSALIEKDKPYVFLNSVVLIGYGLGSLNALL